jgi:hypothetical protein
MVHPNEKAPGSFLPEDKRVGFAIVGLGRLSLNQTLPAFGHSQYYKPEALVSEPTTTMKLICWLYSIT